jgi:xylulokinase
VTALLIALEAIGTVAANAPITLIGGGATGATWRETVARMLGSRVEIPDARELVALGAAVQAAAVLAGKHPTEIAAEWNARGGTVIERRQRDEQALERFRRVLAATSQLNGGMQQ